MLVYVWVDCLAYAKGIDKDHFVRDRNTLIVNYTALLNVSHCWWQYFDCLRWKITVAMTMLYTYIVHVYFPFIVLHLIFVLIIHICFSEHSTWQIRLCFPNRTTVLPYNYQHTRSHTDTLFQYPLKEFVLSISFGRDIFRQVVRRKLNDWNVVLAPAIKWNRKWHRTSIQILKLHRLTSRQK